MLLQRKQKVMRRFAVPHGLDLAEYLDVDIRDMFVPTKGESETDRKISEMRELLKRGISILDGEG